MDSSRHLEVAYLHAADIEEESNVRSGSEVNRNGMSLAVEVAGELLSRRSDSNVGFKGYGLFSGIIAHPRNEGRKIRLARNGHKLGCTGRIL